MSNLLEQAIIDAAALRETALKSAKEALIDKYKDEFKNSLEKILEQEEVAAPPPENTDITSPDANMAQVGIDSNIDVQEEPGGEAFKEVPSSFLDGDDDELIQIDFDKLEKQLSDILGSPVLAAPGMENTDDEELAGETSPQTPEVDIEQQPLAEELELSLEEDASCGDSEQEYELEEDLEEELELESVDSHSYGKDALSPDGMLEETHEDDEVIHLTISDEDGDQEELELEEEAGSNTADIEAQIAQKDKEKATLMAKKASLKQDQIKQGQAVEDNDTSISEDFELTEEELAELEEKMSVDLDPHKQSRGYMGTTETEEEKLHNIEKAAARDDEEEEKREEEKKKLKDLECELQESKKLNNKYIILVEELKDNLITLKEHTEKLSVSNAKLLYINKVFGNSSLNERQKQNIVESISRANSVLEARTIYDTLQSTMESVSSKKPRESLGEALNRGNSGFISRPKVSSLDENMSERMKILAGIKNTN